MIYLCKKYYDIRSQKKGYEQETVCKSFFFLIEHLYYRKNININFPKRIIHCENLKKLFVR